jgi:hypothetical protein
VMVSTKVVIELSIVRVYSMGVFVYLYRTAWRGLLGVDINFLFLYKICRRTTQMASKVALPPVRGAGYEPGIKLN